MDLKDLENRTNELIATLDEDQDADLAEWCYVKGALDQDPISRKNRTEEILRMIKTHAGISSAIFNADFYGFIDIIKKELS